MNHRDSKDVQPASDITHADRPESSAEHAARKQHASDNLDQALQESSDCSDPISPFVPAKAREAESSLRAESAGVNWNDAPGWAQYWCWDERGAHWHRDAPEWVQGETPAETCWREDARHIRNADAQNFGAKVVVVAPAEPYGYNGDAKASLTRRPTSSNE